MAGLRQLMTGVLATLLWPSAFAGTVLVPGPGGDVQVSVSSFLDQRYQDVFRQQYDFSCGSAALATLLSFHYDHPVNEQEVFVGMLAVADEDKVRREGFSMLDMKRYLESEGYQADGFRLPLSGLREQVRVPVIALVTQGATGILWLFGASVSARYW